MEGRTQRIKISEYISEKEHVRYRVPQGSVLGPTLILIYINSLCNLPIENGQIFCYADDTAIVFAGVSWEEVHNSAEKGLRQIAQWLHLSLLTLNVTKSNYMCFSIDKRTQPPNNFTLRIHTCDSQTSNCNCPSLNKVSSTKYLGIMVDERLSWHSHIDLIISRVRKFIWIYKSLRHVVTKELINKIYIALTQSILSYCIPVWGGSTKTKILELERAQRLLLKIMHFKPRRFSTEGLYRYAELLTVRKLYILNVVLKVHRSTGFNNALNKKRKNNVIPIRHTKTVFASRQYDRQSARIYNIVNKKLSVYPLKTYDCKSILQAWLKQLSYSETECLLEVKS